MAVQAMLSDLNHSPVCLNLNSPLAWIKHSAPQYCSLSQTSFCDVRSLSFLSQTGLILSCHDWIACYATGTAHSMAVVQWKTLRD